MDYIKVNSLGAFDGTAWRRTTADNRNTCHAKTALTVRSPDYTLAEATPCIA